ncbi:MAG: TolC family protein [Leptospiraceae bacterium]
MNRSFIFLLLVFLILFSGCQSAEQKEVAPESTDPATTADSSSENPGSDSNESAEMGDESENEPDALEATDPEPTEAETTPNYAEIPLGPNGKPRPLSMKQTIQLVLNNNTSVRIQQLEILKSDTELLKDESQYTPKVDFSFESYVNKQKQTPSTIFQGTQTNQDTYTAGIEKLFRSGTYFRLEGSDTRVDTNAGEGSAAQSNSLLSQLAQPPLHTGAVRILLQQELLKNAFGYNQSRLSDIRRKQALIERERLEFELAQLTVGAMVDYWTLAIAEKEVETSRDLLKNAAYVRGITAQKTGLGLAEPFEVNQWNAVVAQARARLQQAELDRDSQRRNLLRVLNLDPGIQLSGATELIETAPPEVDMQRDIENALATRPDIRIIRRQLEIARLSEDIAENNLLPSVTLGGSYASKDVARYSGSAFDAVPQGKYPEYSVQFKIEYPLWDEGARVEARNARINRRQLRLQEEQISRQVSDDIRQSRDQIKVAYQSVQEARVALANTQAFYYGLVRRYRQGRFSADAVKNALDALVQSRQALTRALINYNISLIRYDLARNAVFTKYDINIDEVIDRLRES